MITIALVGCSKTKLDLPDHSNWCPARELYTSQLFQKRVEHIEARSLPWYILSAKSGLLKPSTQVRPYDQVLSDMHEIDLAAWHFALAAQIMDELYYELGEPKLSSIRVEIHAGKKYCHPLAKLLETVGVQVIKPVEGLGIGEQLAYYTKTKADTELTALPTL